MVPAKAAVDKEWEKLEKISAWNLTQVSSKKEVIDEARTSGATVHFASLMDICHLKNAELMEAKLEKISAWNLTKVKSKKTVIEEARTAGATVHFASLMDICHLKNAELEAKHQKYKGRVVLRGDIVKDNSGSYAVFTEQGSSASQMTAAKIMDIISRLPGCDGQAADAVSAYTQVKMEDAHKLF